MKKLFFILLFLFFISFELCSMEESRKRKQPEEEEKGCLLQKQPQQPPIKRRRVSTKPPQIKTLKEIAKQKFIEVIPELENVPELLESIPAEEVRQAIKAEAQKKLCFEETRLHNATSEQEVENLLTLGVDPNLKDRSGKTALNALIDKGHLNAAFHLVSIALTAIPYQTIPLEKLTEENIHHLIKSYLLATQGNGLDVSSPDEYAVTPLQRAIQKQDLDLVNLIIEILQEQKKLKAKKDEAKGYYLFLPQEAKNIKLPAALNTTNKIEWSAFTLAIRYMPELIDNFISLGASVNEKNQYGEAPLMFAATYNPSLIPTLIKARANIHAKNKKGETALMLAAQNNTEAVQLLIDAGANINIKDLDNETALYHAARFNPNTIEPLIKAGVNPNEKGTNGETPLLAAVSQGSSEAVKKLLEFGADPNGKNNEGLDALTMAIAQDQSNIVKVLLEHGAEITEKTLALAARNREIKELIIPFLGSYLIKAVRENNVEIIKNMLKVGANPNFRDKISSETPLEIAIEKNEPEIIKALLEGGAEITDQSIEKAQGNVEIFNLIAQNFASAFD